jgi:hypothetical protein
VSEIVKLHPAADPDEVIRQAIGIYDSVVILGWTKDENFSGRSSLNLSAGEAILLVELFKMAVLQEAVE